jgi:hypothetical protein
MKKLLKIFLLSLASLALMAAIAIAVVLWFVLTPEKLTPIVRSQAPRYIRCQSEIGQIELTFFSTFPKFALKADRLTLVNPIGGAPNDTLFNAGELIGIIDIRALIKNNELIVRDFRLSNGAINAFVDSLGNSNFNVFPTDNSPQPDTAQAGMTFKIIDIGNVDLKNIDVSYLDRSMNLKAEARHLSAGISGSITGERIAGAVDAQPFDVSLEYRQADSSVLKTEIRSVSFAIDGSLKAGAIEGLLQVKLADILLQYGSINTGIANLSMTVNGKADPETISGDIRLEPFNVTFGLGDQTYLQNALVRLNVAADVNLSRQWIRLKEASATVNGLQLDIAGTLENDTLHQSLTVEAQYKFNSWPVKSIMALVPPSFSSYLNGIDADGKLSSEGRIDGTYSASSFPAADLRILLEKGELKYSAFPVPLRDVNADVSISADGKTPRSCIRINRLQARTPAGSSLKTSGILNNLFTDMYASLDTDLNLALPEWMPLIPDSMKIMAKGTVSGNVKSAFTLSQITRMQLEKIKLSGSIDLADLAVTYDSLSLRTDRSTCRFALPNANPSSAATGFVFANIRANTLEASKINSFNASLDNADITLEASDVRDTTKIPDLRCSFRMNELKAVADSIRVAASGPAGNITVAPRRDAPKYPAISMTYNGSRLQAGFGRNSATAGKIDIRAGVENDPAKKDMLSQWTPKGFIDMEQGKISLASLTYPIEIPSVRMKFDPETFAIETLKALVNRSDFSLSGELNNVSAYFRGDSLLKGEFDFVSDMTDILQIMSLTNGMNHEEEEKEMMSANSQVYLVPKGIDFTLHTDIKAAAYGRDITASDIQGDVQVHDGTLILDGITFATPAAEMQVTGMYRTPRKNHLFVGLNLHMFDVEIGELLQTIPVLDSIMPMLRSFGGKGEFHVSAETYVDSTYRVKMSTIRASSSIRGTDLVLMDGQTFSEVAKKLRFSKKTVNRVDSLSAECTIFRNEVDIYPFLIVMDKYKAVVGGRHNLDMSFDYNISVVQSPLPIRLAVNVKGTPEKMKFRLGKSKYPDFYRPASRKVVETQELELRKMIRNALMGTIIKDQ